MFNSETSVPATPDPRITIITEGPSHRDAHTHTHGGPQKPAITQLPGPVLLNPQWPCADSLPGETTFRPQDDARSQKTAAATLATRRDDQDSDKGSPSRG